MNKKVLEANKKKIGDKKWSYRGFIIFKDKNNLWKVFPNNRDPLLEEERVKKIFSLEPKKSVKDICVEMDEILGSIPGKKKKIIKQETKWKTHLNTENTEAKKIAYEIRWELEKILEKKHSPIKAEHQNKLAVPNSVKFIDKKTFSLIWNKEIEELDIILTKYRKMYKNAEIDIQKEKSTILTVKTS